MRDYKLYFKRSNGDTAVVLAEGYNSHEDAILALKTEHDITTTILAVIK